MSARVTIVTPSYNQAPFLDEALRSVAGQDYPDVEHIVVDGGSTDGSAEIVRRHAERLAWWVSEPDGGQAAALNKGFARATGEILGWLNSDDVLAPGALTAAVEALERAPDALLVYGDNVVVDASGRELWTLRARPFDTVEMLRTAQNHVPQPGSLFRRRAYELAGPFDEESHMYFDFAFVLRLGLHGGAVVLPRTLGSYRLHAGSKSTSASAAKAADHLWLYDAFYGRDDVPAALRAVEAEGRSANAIAAAEYFYAGLEQRRARAALAEALRRYPRHATPRTLGIAARTFLPAALVRRLRGLRHRDPSPSPSGS